MKMKRAAIAVLLTLACSSFTAVQASGLEALAAAEAQGKAEEQRKLDQQRAREAAAKRKREAAAAAAQRKRDQALADLKAERRADKMRDQAFDDDLRELEIQRQKLAIEREMKRVKREDDFIDQELNREKARTDNIQSDADSKRILSGGAAEYMKKSGEAKLEAEKGLF